MPTYSLRCPDHGDTSVTVPAAQRNQQTCPQCDAPMRRVWEAPAVKLTGPGFYQTDYANLDKQREQSRQRLASGEAHTSLVD